MEVDLVAPLLGKDLAKDVGFAQATVGILKIVRHPLSQGFKAEIDVLKYAVEVRERTGPKEE